MSFVKNMIIFKSNKYLLNSITKLINYSTIPALTSTRYPNLKRNNYAQLSQEDIQKFKKILIDDSLIIQDENLLLNYNVDWMKIYRGQSKIVLRPKTTSQVSEILRYCNAKNLAVVPQGGGTGLVGGSVPVFDEIIISMQLMSKILHVDKTSGVMTCEAGCILENLSSYISQHNMIIPIDLGAKGSCHIGGNIATNAGGMRLLRYGSLHANVLGLEAVLADGSTLDCMSSMRKDNVGYHLRHVFIGSEGTLGIITKVAILCPVLPNSVNLAFLGCNSFENVLKVLTLAHHELGEILSAFEFMDSKAFVAAQNHIIALSSTHGAYIPNSISDAPFYILMETSGSNIEHDQAKLESFLSLVSEKKNVIDGVVATDYSQIKSLWRLREDITIGLLDDGYCYKYDISLPHDRYYQIVELMRSRLGTLPTTVCGYGHVGDGNLHFNVTSSSYNSEITNLIEPYLYEYVSQHGGSISAEHGIGFYKRNHLHYGKSEQTIAISRKLKEMLDPKGILNPYKCLPDV